MYRCAAVFLLLFFVPLLCGAEEQVWREEIGPAEVILTRSSSEGETTSRLRISPIGAERVRVHRAKEERALQVRFPEVESRSEKSVFPPANALVEGIELARSQEGFAELQVLLSEEANLRLRVRSGSYGTILEASFPEGVGQGLGSDPIFAAHKRGDLYPAPAVQVWGAKVESRPLREEVVESLSGSIQEGEEAELAEQEGAPETDSVRARFLDEGIPTLEQDPQQGSGTAVTVEPSSMILMGTEEGIVRLENNRKESVLLKPLVQELLEPSLPESPSAFSERFIFEPAEVALEPGAARAVSIRLVRAAASSEEVFDIQFRPITARAEEISLKVFAQPEGGRAVLRWERGKEGVQFSNEGNISTELTELKACQAECSLLDPVRVYPGKSASIPLEPSAELRLVQRVGDRSQNAVIPAYTVEPSP